MIEIITPAGVEKIYIKSNAPVSKILEMSENDYSHVSMVSHNGQAIKKVEFDSTYIAEGRLVILPSRNIVGHVPTPTFKKAEKYLISHGYERTSGGKGDHQKYKKQNAETILLNHDNYDKKHICLGSAKTMAKSFGFTLAELYHEVM